MSAEVTEVISDVFRDKGWKTDEIEERLRVTTQRGIDETLEALVCVAVFDSHAHVVGFCIGIQAGDAILTVWAMTSQRGAARWLCFSGFVEEASARGARFIIGEPPWAFTGGNKVFAGHLGFSAARVRGVLVPKAN